MTFEPVYIVDGARSPFLKSRNEPGHFSASDMAVQAGRELLLRQRFRPQDLGEVIVGCAAPAPDEINIGRVISLRLGCGNDVPAWTVMRNCASGMQALDSALMSIQAGRYDLALAGGVDALSRAPVLLNNDMVTWLARWGKARNTRDKLRALQGLRPQYFKPVIGLLKGLTDPVVGLSMGQTAENLAHQFGITRSQMDDYAARSHALTRRAQQQCAMQRSVSDGVRCGEAPPREMGLHYLEAVSHPIYAFDQFCRRSVRGRRFMKVKRDFRFDAWLTESCQAERSLAIRCCDHTMVVHGAPDGGVHTKLLP